MLINNELTVCIYIATNKIFSHQMSTIAKISYILYLLLFVIVDYIFLFTIPYKLHSHKILTVLRRFQNKQKCY